MSRCVLLDNNPFSFLQQPCNGIPVEPFAGDADDRQAPGSLSGVSVAPPCGWLITDRLVLWWLTHVFACCRQLLTVLLPMLESLSQVPDVRPCLAAKYGMASWFAERGYDVSHLC